MSLYCRMEVARRFRNCKTEVEQILEEKKIFFFYITLKTYRKYHLMVKKILYVFTNCVRPLFYNLQTFREPRFDNRKT